MIPCKNTKFVKTLTKSKENEKSTLSFKEPLKRLNKEKSKDLTVNDSLTGLHKGQNASKIMFLKIWNCFKIPRIWRKILILPFLFDMHFSQKLQ